MSGKPKVALTSIPILCEIDRHIRQYDIRGESLREAASNVLDGSATRGELCDLLRRRLLVKIEPVERCTGICCRGIPRADRLCGDGWTVDLSDRAMRALWPERIAGRRALEERDREEGR